MYLYVLTVGKCSLDINVFLFTIVQRLFISIHVGINCINVKYKNGMFLFHVEIVNVSIKKRERTGFYYTL